MPLRERRAVEHRMRLVVLRANGALAGVRVRGAGGTGRGRGWVLFGAMQIEAAAEDDERHQDQGYRGDPSGIAAGKRQAQHERYQDGHLYDELAPSEQTQPRYAGPLDALGEGGIDEGVEDRRSRDDAGERDRLLAGAQERHEQQSYRYEGHDEARDVAFACLEMHQQRGRTQRRGQKERRGRIRAHEGFGIAGGLDGSRHESRCKLVEHQARHKQRRQQRQGRDATSRFGLGRDGPRPAHGGKGDQTAARHQDQQAGGHGGHDRISHGHHQAQHPADGHGCQHEDNARPRIEDVRERHHPGQEDESLGDSGHGDARHVQRRVQHPHHHQQRRYE